MFEGRIFVAETVSLRAASAASLTMPGDGPGVVRSALHEAFNELYSAPDFGVPGPESETYFDPDPALGWIRWLSLYGYSSFGTGANGYSLDIPSLGISVSGSDPTWLTPFEVLLEVDSYRLNCRYTNRWRTRYGEIRLYYNGVLVHTFSGGILDGSAVITPWSMSFIGIYPRLWAPAPSASWSQEFPTTEPFSSVPFDWVETASIEQAITGGIRFKQNGVWYALPVAHSEPTIPSVSGACAAGIGSTSGLDTWNVVLNQSSSRTEGGAFCTETDPNIAGVATIRRSTWVRGEVETAGVWVWPNNERKIVRKSNGYRALWFRWGFPLATGRGHSSYESHSAPFPSIPPASSDSQSIEVQVLGEYTQLLSTVGEDYHVIEEPLTATLRMPTKLTGSFEQAQEASTTVTYSGPRLSDWFPLNEDDEYTGLPPACPNPAFDPPNACFAQQSWEWPYKVATVAGSSGNIPVVHKHRHPYVRLWATWWHPHWQYGLWFPPDEADESVQWTIGGSPAAPKLYWLPIAQQWIRHPALSEDENRRTRNFVRTEPLDLSWFKDYIELSWFGQYTSWVGISRFEAVLPDIPDSITLDDQSEPAWSVESGGSLAFGSDVVLTPTGTGPGERTLWLDYGRFEDSAGQYPYICDSVYLDWLTTNLSQVKVYVESYTEKLTLLELNAGDGYTTRNHVYKLQRVNDDKYGGSYAQDHSCGFIYDTGEDTLPTGVSEDLTLDNERQYAYGLLQGGHGVRLKFVLSIDELSLPITLKYPRWEYQTEEEPRIEVETSSTATMLMPGGPGARFGQWRFWDYDGDNPLTTPLFWPLGARMSAYCALGMKRVGFLGTKADDGLSTEIASLFDYGEEYTQEAHLARDPINQERTTHGFLTYGVDGKPVIVLVSSLREVPPLAGFPFRERDDDWQPTGDHKQVCYTDCTEPRRYIVNGNSAMNLHHPEGHSITSLDFEILGWIGTKHTEPTDGLELIDYELKIRGTAIGRMRPWDGTFVLYDVSTGVQRGVCNARSVRGFYAEAEASEGRVDVDFVYGPYPKPTFSRSGAVTGDGQFKSPALAILPNRSMMLVYVLDNDGINNAYRHISRDDAKTWSTPELAFEGVTMIRNFSDDHSKLYGEVAFRYNSGDSGPGKLYGKTRQGGQSTLGAEFTLKNHATGSELQVTDEGFDLVAPHAAGRPIVLVCTIHGDSDRSTWVSQDDGRSFRRVTP